MLNHNFFKTAFSFSLTSFAMAQNIAADRALTLVITADTTCTARRASIPFEEVGSVSAGGEVTSGTSPAEAAGSLVIARMLKAGLGGFYTNYLSDVVLFQKFNAFCTATAPYFTIASYAYTAVGLYDYYVTSDHTYLRVYEFFAPVDGFYDITFWVPGDWDKPASDVYATSYCADGDITQTLLNQTMVSDQTITRNVYLRKGDNSIKIDLGSGSVMIHNAGHLVSVQLNNPTYLTWTHPGLPVVLTQASLINLISSEMGGSKTNYLTYNPILPFTITDGNAPIFTNPTTTFLIPAKPPIYSYKINRFSSVDVDRFYQMPDAAITSDFTNGMGTFTTTRLADYIYEIETFGDL